MQSFEEMIETDGLYLDDADRAKLEQLPETEREKLLYKRYCSLKEVEEKKKLRELVSPKPKEGKEEESSESRLSFADCDFVFNKKDITSNIFKPFFSQFVGCFVRAKIGNEYKVCKIVSISTKRPYPIDPGKAEKTDTYLDLDTGKKICSQVEVTILSSKEVEEKEFNDFVSDFKISSLDSIKAKHKKVLGEMRRKLTNEEHLEMMRIRERANPKKMTKVVRKIDLILKRDAALARKDKERAKHYQELLEGIENAERRKKWQEVQDEISAAKRRRENGREREYG